MTWLVNLKKSSCPSISLTEYGQPMGLFFQISQIFWAIGQISQISCEVFLGIFAGKTKSRLAHRIVFCLLFCFSQQTKQICSLVLWENLWLAKPAFGFIRPLVLSVQIQSLCILVWDIVLGYRKFWDLVIICPQPAISFIATGSTVCIVVGRKPSTFYNLRILLDVQAIF